MSISLTESKISPLLISTKLAGDCGEIVSTTISSLWNSFWPVNDCLMVTPMEPDKVLESITFVKKQSRT